MTKEEILKELRAIGKCDLADRIETTGMPVEIIAPVKCILLSKIFDGHCKITFTNKVDTIILSWKKPNPLVPDTSFQIILNHYAQTQQNSRSRRKL